MTQKDPAASGFEKAERLATVSVPLNRNGLILLGTFGSDARPGALLRLPNGKTQRVEPGDSLGDSTVLAVASGSVVVKSAGQTMTLKQPGERRMSTLVRAR